MRLDEIAGRIGGRVDGDGSIDITRLASLSEAGAGDLSFLSNKRYAAAAATTRAAAIVAPENWEGPCPCARLRVANPDYAFALAAALVSPPAPEPAAGVHATAIVADDVSLGRDVRIGPWCVLEAGVRIGDGTWVMAGGYIGHGSVIGTQCRFYPHVSIRERTTIGNRVILHNGVVVGSDGFGNVMVDGAWKKIPQVGVVEIGDDVEIGSNSTVDRARFGRTVIGNDVKIDNLVQVGHNVRVGDHTAMAAQVGLAGSCTIGKYVQLGGQAGVIGHVTVGDGVAVGGQSGVIGSVAPRQVVSGFPAIAHRDAMKQAAALGRLPELRQTVRDLERRLAALEAGADGEDA